VTSVVSAEMSRALGAQLTRTVSYPIAASDIRRWALAVYWPERPPARYLAVDDSDLVAPEEFNPFAWAVVEATPPAAETIPLEDPDRIEKMIGVAGPGLRNQVHGGISVEYGTRMVVGDVVTSVTTLEDYSERDGRLGHMLMTTVVDAWTTRTGGVVKRSRLTFIRY
jgi:hypothetical protein